MATFLIRHFYCIFTPSLTENFGFYKNYGKPFFKLNVNSVNTGYILMGVDTWNISNLQVSSVHQIKTKTPRLDSEKQGFLWSGHGNLSVKVGVIYRILISYHNPALKVNFRHIFSFSCMKLHSFRQDYQDYFGLVWRYPVHPVDPVRKIKLHFVKFFFRLDRPFFWSAAWLTYDFHMPLTIT